MFSENTLRGVSVRENIYKIYGTCIQYVYTYAAYILYCKGVLISSIKCEFGFGRLQPARRVHLVWDFVFLPRVLQARKPFKVPTRTSPLAARTRVILYICGVYVCVCVLFFIFLVFLFIIRTCEFHFAIHCFFKVCYVALVYTKRHFIFLECFSLVFLIPQIQIRCLIYYSGVLT